MSQLLLAARDGDVKFLIDAVGTEPVDYFLVRSKSNNGQEHYNIFHIAVLSEQAEFLREALDRLPITALQLLFCQQDFTFFGYNAFHCAALRGNLPIVKLLVEFYKSAASSSSLLQVHLRSKPWLDVDVNGKTPFMVALEKGKDECALEIMSLDPELLCNLVDNKGISPLFQAVQQGCVQVSVKILTFQDHPYSTLGDNKLTPLHVLPNCSEEVCRLLLEKHPEMIKEVDKYGCTILHTWVMMGKLWPFQVLLNLERTSKCRMDFINLLCVTEKPTGNNPFHTAVYNTNRETLWIVQLLVQAYIDAYEQGDVLQPSPWNQENVDGMTPLMASLIHKEEKLALYFLSVDMKNLVIHATKSVLFYTVQHSCDEVAEHILTSVDLTYFNLVPLRGNRGQNVLHVASNCKERTCKLLVEKLPWLINEPDEDGKTPLDTASEVGISWLIELLLKKDPSSSTNAPFAWIEACKRGHLGAIHAFINHSPDFRTFCFQRKDSPLHHIKLTTYWQYKEFLSIPMIQEMKNMVDFSGATPLHRALERKDLLLAEALLSSDGVFRSIKDKNGKSATDLLGKLCNQESKWDEMCWRAEINPRLNMNYMGTLLSNSMRNGSRSIRQGTMPSAGEMRGTLSLVAALLATLTFAVGFTLPGGLNEDVGEATLANKASFLVFILADTYAMCCSMLVLFCLIWSMVSDRDKSLLLINQSVVILMQSLYGTLVAFMTGVYATVSQKSLWAAIIVIVMCSLLAILSNRFVLDKVLNRLIPSASSDRRRV